MNGPIRRLTINEKLAILEEYDRVEFGQRTAFCRARGFNEYTVQEWAKKRRQGLLKPTDKKESRLALTRAERLEYEVQKKKIAELEARLEQTENAVEILGKASALLESLTKGAEVKEFRPFVNIDPEQKGGNRYER